MTWLALDIGGANLKAADGRGWARSVPFSLWDERDGLSSALAQLLLKAPECTRCAVTMTGELCDAFRTKAEGVRRILASVDEIAAGRAIRVYSLNGRLALTDEAREMPHLVAASNWHALARFAGRFVEGVNGLLVDIGSTTTDIIPLVRGLPAARGMNDTERLLAGELVYTGVGNTPICAVTRVLPWRQRQCPVAAEFFATTADVYHILGEIPEQPDASRTADGRPMTRQFARERIARMICADRTSFAEADANLAAEFVRTAQLAQLRMAIVNCAQEAKFLPMCVVISGAGEFLARQLTRELWDGIHVVSIAEELGPDVSDCAPAHALAVLAREMESA